MSAEPVVVRLSIAEAIALYHLLQLGVLVEVDDEGHADVLSERRAAIANAVEEAVWTWSCAARAEAQLADARARRARTLNEAQLNEMSVAVLTDGAL